MPPAVAAPSRGAPSDRVTRPPVARATPAEGAAPPRRHLHDHRPGQSRCSSNRFRTVVLIAHRGLFVAGTDHHVAFGRGCTSASVPPLPAWRPEPSSAPCCIACRTGTPSGSRAPRGHTTIPRLHLPPHHVNQGSTAGYEHPPTQRARACAGCRRHRLRRGPGRRGSRVRSHRPPPRRATPAR